MNTFKDFFDEQFEEKAPTKGPRVFSTPEVNRLTREGLVSSALEAIKHYKNTSPKYIVSKMGFVAGGGSEDMCYYDGAQGNAKILTELIMQGVIALNLDGHLYIV